MTRTRALLWLLALLPLCAGQTGCATTRDASAQRAQALIAEGRARGDVSRLEEAARMVPESALSIRLDIAESLMEDFERWREADDMVLEIFEDAVAMGDAEATRRAAELLGRKTYAEGGAPGGWRPIRVGCLSVDDRDDDGYDDHNDACPELPEDFDSFEDEDGCPDRDNDGDGVLDAAALTRDELNRTYRWQNNDRRSRPDGREEDCRNEPEDYDGVADEDGCPDVDAPEASPSASPTARVREQLLRRLERDARLPPDVLARLRR